MSTATDSIPSLAPLYAALARAIGRAGGVDKDAKNSFHGYKYASAEGLIAEAREALASEELAVFSSSWQVIDRERENAAALGYFADVAVIYTVAHSSGAAMVCNATTPVISEKGRPEDKAVATALTYNLGYFLRGLLLLPRVDADHDADQRDDRNYEPQASRQGQQRDQRPPQSAAPPRSQAPTNGHSQPSGAPRNGNGKAEQPIDVTADLLAFSGARNLTELERAGQRLAGMAEGPQRTALVAAYRKRREELGGAAAATGGGPATATEPTPAPDRGWVDFCADMGAVLKSDCATWNEDDFGAEFAALVEKTTSRKDLAAKAEPWVAASNKRSGIRVRALRATFKRLFDDRSAQLAEQPAAGAA